MKKLVALSAVALMTSSAFANTHMVRMFGWDQGQRTNSFDFSTSSDDSKTESNVRNIAINYAYAITGSFQVGATYKNYSLSFDDKTLGGTSQTLGFSGYYNLAGSTIDTTYLALHYETQTYSDDGQTVTVNTTTVNSKDGNKQSNYIIEAGHRFSVGTGLGFNLNYAPSVMYSIATDTVKGQDDLTTNTLTWNFLKFDVLF